MLNNLNLDLLGNLEPVLTFDCCQTNYHTSVAENNINLISCSLVGQLSLSLWITGRCWCRVLCFRWTIGERECSLFIQVSGNFLESVG